MKKTIRLAAMILAAVMTMAALAGCGGGSSSSSGSADSGAAAKIGFVNEANTDVFDNTRMTALQTLADEVGGYNIEYSDANLDIQKQIDQANTFLSKNLTASSPPSRTPTTRVRRPSASVSRQTAATLSLWDPTLMTPVICRAS